MVLDNLGTHTTPDGKVRHASTYTTTYPSEMKPRELAQAVALFQQPPRSFPELSRNLQEFRVELDVTPPARGDELLERLFRVSARNQPFR